MKTLNVEKSWHKANSDEAMTYKQYEYVTDLMLENPELVEGWNFPSCTQAQRCITKYAAADIISALKEGTKVIISE